MDKRLRKHPVICEQDQFNCMMGLISMLDFRRQRRLNQNLLSTQKRRNSVVNNKDGFTRGGDLKSKVYLPNPCVKSDQVEESVKTKKKVRRASRGGDDLELPVYQCRDEATHNSTEKFSKAVEVLNWNKELCLKLLQDPNSPNLQDLQTKAGIEEVEEEKKIKYDNLLKKIKNDKHEHNSAVVVMKPRPRTVAISEDVSCNCSINTHHSLRKGQQSSKPVTFSKSIKKKCSKEEETWKTAIRMEDKSNSTIEKNKKKTENACQVLSIVNDSKQKQFDIYLEAKRHMSQRLRNLVQDGASSSQEQPKTLRRILSLPKQESPTYHHPPKEQKLEDPTKTAAADDQLGVSDTDKEKRIVNENGSSSSSCKLSSGMGKRESEEWASGGREEHPSPVSILEPFFTDYLSSPSTPGSQSANSSMLLLPHRLDFEEYSSATILSSPAPSGILGTCLDDYEDDDGGGESDRISKYVKSVLRSCPMNWEDIFLKMDMSGNVLDQMFFDELELCPTDSYWKHKVLFDCTNEAFLDTCRSHFSSLAWLSGFNKDLFVVDREVVERVNRYFVHHPMPQTLQDLVTDDVMKTWKWMDLGFDIDCVAFRIADFILADLIFDII
ncbi:uncharacterized protein LOC124946126 isoform X2 [Impatiens glandulifera]|nr:uncharacterized protein LOC124946126 isoform X2 [Impatiens glandulifera]